MIKVKFNPNRFDSPTRIVLMTTSYEKQLSLGRYVVGRKEMFFFEFLEDGINTILVGDLERRDVDRVLSLKSGKHTFAGSLRIMKIGENLQFSALSIIGVTHSVVIPPGSVSRLNEFWRALKNKVDVCWFHPDGLEYLSVHYAELERFKKVNKVSGFLKPRACKYSMDHYCPSSILHDDQFTWRKDCATCEGCDDPALEEMQWRM